MSSEKSFNTDEHVLTPLSDLVVGTEEGVDLVLGAATVFGETRDGMVEVSFDGIRMDDLGTLVDERAHPAAERVTGPQTAAFEPAELERADGAGVRIPAESLGQVPQLR